MRYKVYCALEACVMIATGVGVMCGVPAGWIVGGFAAMPVLLFLMVYSVRKPLRAVENGLYLLRDQDFSSRLRKTGQPDADKVVELYNSLIESMKKERLRIQEQDKFLKLVVDASPMGIAICNYDGDIMETNRAWDNMQSEAMTQAIKSVNNGETRTVRMADALIVRISKLWFMDSGFRRNFILIERLTDEIAMAEKQMFNKIVRTIGHEVNNTLGSVISVLDSLAEMHGDDALTADAISSSSKSCTNLVSFVRGYADIVKLPPVTAEAVDVNRWLTGLMPYLKKMAPANVSIEYHPDAESHRVLMDTMLMERVMINIVKNAVESIGERPEGRIDITFRDSVITVTDNGRGISAEASDKLFTPFYSTKRPDRGLGLMLISDVLRAHKARFSLSTSAATGLTTFMIDLGRKKA